MDLTKLFNQTDALNPHMINPQENQIRELEKHFPQLRQRLDVRSVSIIGHLASRFTGDRDKDMALLRGNIEILYKPGISEALLKNIDSETDYTLELVEYARMNRLEMKRLFR
jgi:hypothetical protein